MTAKQFLGYCKQFLGRPYIWGASGPDEFDCSGFVQYVFARIALDPPDDQTADELYRYFRKPENGTAVLKGEAGCLIFYGKRTRIGHVAICIDDKKMIEAGGGGPETTTIEIARREGAEVKISSINRRSDSIAIIRPNRLPWLL